MPPKVKVTKDAIIHAAVELVRERGAESLNARTLAEVLNCSTQPIFSNFKNMEELRFVVVKRADVLCKEYMSREVETGKYPPYKANGMAYIRFAKEEKELFKLLYMRDRTVEMLAEESVIDDQMEEIVHQNTGLDAVQTRLFHLEMWTCVHGIATMFATSFVKLEWDLVSKILTDVYQGLRKQYGMEV